MSSGLLRDNSSGIALIQRLLDASIIAAAQWVAMTLYGQPWIAQNTLAAVSAVATFQLLSEFNGLYGSWRGRYLRSEMGQLTVTWGITLSVLFALAFATKTSTDYSRVAMTAWFVSTPVALGIVRVGVRAVLRSMRRRGFNTRRAAIVGCTRLAERLIETLKEDKESGLVVHGMYDDRSPVRRDPVIERLAPWAGDLRQLITDCKEGRIDYVYITLPLRAEERTQHLTRRLADTTATVFFVPDLQVFDLLHARWGAVGELPVVSIFDTPFLGVGGWMKRLEDIVIGTVALLLVAPIMIGCAIAVKVNSPGPVFFRQRRYGLSGKEILVWKFRTMKVCEDGPVIQQASSRDPRVTRVGSFLRRSSLDELPQLFNVLDGTMSLVGPRPHAVAHNELYRGRIHGYMLRHKVKPGITGWAQVNGWRGETDTIEKMERRIEHDLYYIRNWRLFLDLKILFLTAFGRRVRQNAH